MGCVCVVMEGLLCTLHMIASADPVAELMGVAASNAELVITMMIMMINTVMRGSGLLCCVCLQALNSKVWDSTYKYGNHIAHVTACRSTDSNNRSSAAAACAVRQQLV